MTIGKKLVSAFRSVLRVRATQIHGAAMAGNVDKLKSILARKPELVNAENEYGWTALHWAAKYGHREAVEFLIAKGAEVSVRNKDNCTPLHMAALCGKDPFGLLLHAAAFHFGGEPKLEETSTNGGCHKEVVEVLIAKGSDVNAKDKQDMTPLHEATFAGHKDLVELLIAKGASVNARDKRGYTPLFMAAFVGHKDVADLLRKHGGIE